MKISIIEKLRSIHYNLKRPLNKQNKLKLADYVGVMIDEIEGKENKEVENDN